MSYLRSERFRCQKSLADGNGTLEGLPTDFWAEKAHFGPEITSIRSCATRNTNDGPHITSRAIHRKQGLSWIRKSGLGAARDSEMNTACCAFDGPRD